MKTVLVATALAATLLSSAANAATITLLPDTCSNKEPGCTAIVIEGQIYEADGGRFLELMLKNNPQKALVVLDSPGGSIDAALQIGRFIHANGWATFVPNKTYCVSACAMIWLAGGDLKHVSTTARIGFHAAYTLQKGRASESGMFNALVGAYYSELGYTANAIRFFTSAPPNGVSWMNGAIAKELGVEATVYQDQNPEPKQETTANRKPGRRS